MRDENTYQPRFFRSNRVPTPGLGSRVDATQGILRDVVLVQEGEASGHGVHLEKHFIEKVVRFAGEKPQGVKARFGHPNMSEESLGTYLGKFHNVRYREIEGRAQAIGDLHLAEASRFSPRGDLRKWVLQMAKDNPEDFGNSIVFLPGETYAYDENGERRPYDRYYGWKSKDDEDEEYDAPQPEKIYQDIEDLLGSDLVDEGAATESLFSKGVNRHAYAVAATRFFDAEPQVWEFVRAHRDELPEKFQRFVDRYQSYLNKMTEQTQTPAPATPVIGEQELDAKIGSSVSRFFNKLFAASENTSEQPEAKPAEDTEVKAAIAHFSEQVQALQTEIAELQESYKAEKERVEALEAENAELKASLSAAPAAEPTPVKAEEVEPQPEENFYHRIGKAAAIARKLHKR